MAVDPIKYNQIPTAGTLEAGDTVLGEKVNGTTGRLTVGQLQPSDGDKGDITVSGSGLVWGIDTPSSVTLATDDKLLLKDTSGSNVMGYTTPSALATTLNLSGTNTGDQTTIVGISGTKTEYNTSCSDGNFLYADGGTATGVYDFGGADSFEVPNSAAPTVDVDGEIAVDTSVTDFSHGILKYYGGEELGVVALPIAQFTSPTNGYAILYNSTADEFQLGAVSSFNPNTTAGTENVVSGSTAGDSITSGGNYNTLLGYDAGTAITTSDNNTAVGHSALKAVTTSATNATAVGHSALTAVTSGTGMVAVGYLAGATWTTQTDGIAIGSSAASANSGAGNIAIGTTAMANGTASRATNIVIGHGAGNFGTGNTSVIVGNGTAGRQHGTDTVYVGNTAGQNSTGASNTAVGANALSSATGGAAANNVAVGIGTMIAGATGAVAFTSATGNTCIGSRAGINDAACLNAIAVGRDAVTTIATGATSGDDGPGIAIGSAAYPVGFRGDGTIFSAVGASAGYWKVKINGTAYKIQLFANA
jgi:hypothetical protein